VEDETVSIHAHKLPTIARSKLLELESAADEAQGLVAKTTLRIKELEVAIGTAGADSDTSVANLEHELSRLRAVQSKQQSLHSHRAQLAARLGQWLYTLSPNVQLVDVKARRPVLAKGETHLQAVTRIRSDIEKLKNELRLVQQAGPPIADVKRQARDYVRTLAERGRPTIKVGYETGFELVMPTSSYSSTPLLSAVLAWIDPDTLINKINAEIDRMPKPPMSLSKKDRLERFAYLTTEFAALERSEERMIEAAAEQGQDIPRRVDASPAAVLNVEPKDVTAAKPKVA
jgi:hypothetical protein